MTFYYFTISRLRKDASKNLFIIVSNLSRQNHLQAIYRD